VSREDGDGDRTHGAMAGVGHAGLGEADALQRSLGDGPGTVAGSEDDEAGASGSGEGRAGQEGLVRWNRRRSNGITWS
jgi:hypothetical protein